MTENVTVTNSDNGNTLAYAGVWAGSFFKRLRGLLGKKEMCQGEALVLYPCNAVHCIGMRFVIDVAFLDQSGRVVCIMETMKPGSVSPVIKTARYAVELPAGQIGRTQTMLGHTLRINHY